MIDLMTSRAAVGVLLWAGLIGTLGLISALFAGHFLDALGWVMVLVALGGIAGFMYTNWPSPREGQS